RRGRSAMATVFDHVPHSPRGHFRLNFYAAVTRLIAFLADGDHGLDAQLGRFPFLAGYLAELRRNLPPDLPIDETAPWWEREIASWEAATGEHLPLRALAALGVDHERRMALMLAGLVDEDSRF